MKNRRRIKSLYRTRFDRTVDWILLVVVVTVLVAIITVTLNDGLRLAAVLWP